MPIIRTLCLALSLCLLPGCFSTKSSMAEYTPIERVATRNQIKLTPRPDWNTPTHRASVQEVFQANKIKYKQKDGKLLIKKELAADWRTLSDYTMMANDPDWKKKAALPKSTNVRPTPQIQSGWTIQPGGR